MSNSSQPLNSSYNLNNITIIGSLGPDTITISPTEYSYQYDTMASGAVNSISTGSGAYYQTSGAAGSITYDTITINGITNNTFHWNTPKEWVEAFPEWARVNDMCKQYPALEIALRNFQTIYQLVKDDYDNPTPKK